MARDVTVFGAGSWGTALSVALADAGHNITLWARRPEAADAIRTTGHNPTYLPEVPIPDAVRVTADVEAAARGAGLWAIATPSQAVREMMARLQPFVDTDHIVVSLAKGIENETLQTTTQVIHDAAPELPKEQIGVLYGPSHAEEVAQQQPTTVVAAAPDPSVAETIQSTFITKRLRIYVNTDVTGVEIAGSVKNVFAIAAGIGDGIGYGDNAKAAIITRGLAEMRRLGQVLGAEMKTFAGLAGIGDLVVTCTSRHSRNRHLGEQIGQGKTLEDVEDEMEMIAEGVRTTESVHDLARRHQIEMPITEAVYQVLFSQKSPRKAVDELMTRPPKREHYHPEAVRGEM